MKWIVSYLEKKRSKAEELGMLLYIQGEYLKANKSYGKSDFLAKVISFLKDGNKQET